MWLVASNYLTILLLLVLSGCDKGSEPLEKRTRYLLKHQAETALLNDGPRCPSIPEPHVDAWGSTTRIVCFADKIRIVSDGADRMPGTEDDLFQEVDRRATSEGPKAPEGLSASDMGAKGGTHAK